MPLAACISLLLHAVLGSLLPTPAANEIELHKLSGGKHVSFSWSLGSRHVLYISDHEVANEYRMYVVPTLGPAVSVKVSGDLTVWDLNTANITNRVAFVSKSEAPGAIQLYSTSIFGGDPHKLSPTPVNGGNVTYYQVSPDGSEVAYIADQDVLGEKRLYVVPIDGSAAPRQLSGVAPATSVRDFKFAPSGEFILFRTGYGSLYYAPRNSSATPKLVSVGHTLADPFFDYKISPNSQRFVFSTADGIGYNLYVSPCNGDSAPRRLTSFPGLGVQRFAIDPAFTRVICNEKYSGGSRLKSVQIDGGQPPAQLCNKGSNDLFITQDGSRLVFRSDLEVQGLFQIYSVPTDGSLPVIRLNLDTTMSMGYASFSLTSDGSHVLHGLSDRAGWFTVPVDRSSEPVLLSRPGDEVLSWAIGVGQVAFETRQTSTGPIGLYVTRDDGSAVPRLVTGIPAFSRPYSTRFSADGTKLLIHQDLEAFNVRELYAVSFAPQHSAPGQVPGRTVTTTH